MKHMAFREWTYIRKVYGYDLKQGAIYYDFS
jgi:hypothetical protein